MRTIAEDVLCLGTIGQPGVGKTFTTERLCWAAGVDPAKASAETSTPILRFVNSYRIFLLDHAFQLVSQSRNDVLGMILSQAPAWLAQAGDGLLPEFPDDAFADIEAVDKTVAKEILENILCVFRNRKPYLEPITVHNKSTLHIRPLLSAINPAISDPACLWMRDNGFPEVTNLWPYWAGRQLERIHAEHPDYMLLLKPGLRRPGDTQWVHANGGLVIKRVRPSANLVASHTGHSVEQELLVPDIILGGDCAIDEEHGTYDELRDALAAFYELVREPHSNLRREATGRGAAGNPLYIHLPDLIEEKVA